MRNVTILLVAAAMLVLAVPVQSAIYTWDGDGDEWHDLPSNWVDGGGATVSPPWDRFSHSAYIRNGKICEIATTGTECQYLKIGCYGTCGHVKLTGGSLAGAIVVIANQSSSDIDPTFTHEGGTNTCPYIRIGEGATAGHKGIYKISGGSITQSGSTRYIRVGVNAAGATSGTGEFVIEGVNPAISLGGAYTQGSTSTLTLILNSSGNVSFITTLNATLDGTLQLLASDGLTTPTPGGNPITVMKVSGALDYYNSTPGDRFDLDAGSKAKGWYLQDVAGTGADTGKTLLQAVPEPATLALLGIGGLGVLLRRRKK